jgi:hypothetical protein
MINFKIFKNIFKKDIKHNFCHYIMGHFCDKIMPKICQKFYCKICDYGTCKKSSFDNHLLSTKHKKRVFGDGCDANYALIMPSEKKYICEKCEKSYLSRNGLWSHKKTCSEKLFHNVNEKELIFTLLKENKDLQSMMIEQQNMVLELCKNGISNTTNVTQTNSNNKTFNLQIFLNETCKDAMNITDFVQSIQLQLTDLEKVGEIGYIDGISNIILKNLKGLDITQRPIHCTDKKREVLYVKDENKWEKEDEENKTIRKAIKQVAHKNTRLLSQFREKYPDCGKSESKYSDQYNKLIIEAMGGRGNDDMEKENKIIKRIAKEVIIEK